MTQLTDKDHKAQMADMASFDMKYAAAVQAIKEAIQRSQARALHVVNSEVLSLYYGIGRYISENSRKGFWGTGALAQISGQLQKEMPGLKGYSETSLKDMRTFYEQWQPLVNRQPMADEFDRMVVEVAISDYTKPMGVATFQLGKNAPEDLTRVLPPAEELGRCIGNSGSTVGQT